MFKPLLRTMPSLSGNVKIVCILTNYNEIENHIFEANVRTARLNAISSQLYDKYYNISLLQSSYEWDIRGFYKKYSDWFYKKLYDVNKIDLPIYNEFGTNKNRNTDFEFGLKRISYQKSNKQFGFFAPIYIENETDLPDYFEINIDLQNNIYKANRKIRVNIANKINEGANYLGKYIYDYAKKIDNSVVYLNKDENEAVYYGIDVISGGFSTKHDSVISSIFNKQNSILNFDNTINKGFERNKLIVRQIIPLTFYFSVNDILSELEKSTFYGSELTISGKWIKNGKEIKLQDFYVDYLNFKPTVLQLNNENGGMNWTIPTVTDKDGIISNINIMNIGYPSMKESLFWGYRFSNKFTPNFSRWKLKYSNDENPYVTNLSTAFSLYQNSKTKYHTYPNLYGYLTGLVSKKPYYLNLLFPLNDGMNRYDTYTINKYRQTQNNYCSTWFETFYSIDDVLRYSVKVDDNKAFFNGILYNLQNIYDSSNKTINKIDRFGVFINPVMNNLTDEQIREENIYSNNTIFKQNSKYVTKPNCHVNDNTLTANNPLIFSNIKTSVNKDEISKNRIFTYNKEDDGDFISLSDYGIDWYKTNDFIKVDDIEDKLDENIYLKLKKESTEGYDIIPIYRLSNIITENNVLNPGFRSNNLYVSDFGSKAKIKIDSQYYNVLSKDDIKNKNSLYRKTFYRHGNFINRESTLDILTYSYLTQLQAKYPDKDYSWHKNKVNKFAATAINIINSATSYQYNPILSTASGENYSFKTFTENQTIAGNFYGDKLPYNKIQEDNDFIWVDSYNLNNIINHYNNTWLKNDLKLSYYLAHNELSYKDSNGEYHSIIHKYWDNNYVEQTPNYITTIRNKIYNEIIKFYRATSLTNTIPCNTLTEKELKIVKFLYSLTRRIIITGEPYESGEVDKYGNPIMKYKYANAFYLDSDKNYPLVTILFTITGNDGFINPDGVYFKEYDDMNRQYTSSPFIVFNNDGIGYSWLQLVIALQIVMNIGVESDNMNSYYKLRNIILSQLYDINKTTEDKPNKFEVMGKDGIVSKYFYCKFLNMQHLKFYNRCIKRGPNDLGAEIHQNALFIRRRWIDDNLMLKDSFIPVYNLFSWFYNTDLAFDKFVNELEFDNKTNLFYFKNLKYEYTYEEKTNGEFVRDKDKEIYFIPDYFVIEENENGILLEYPVIRSQRYDNVLRFANNSIRKYSLVDKSFIINGSKVGKLSGYKDYSLFGNPEYLFDFENEDGIIKRKIFNPKKFQFEIVFKKQMIKVDTNIWRLINLDEEYAAPYKDLYLYEIEKDEEINPNLIIDKVYGDINERSNISLLYSSNIANKRGVLKPLFNIASIEDKDEAKIYTEYSINNITKTIWNNELVYPIEGKTITEKTFYRHNCNNVVTMYDLSTMNRSIPIEIKDKKYFYKKDWNENDLFYYAYDFVPILTDIYKTKEDHEKAVEKYIEDNYRYFTNTYDLFGLNDIDFIRYSTYENIEYPANTYSYDFTYSISYTTLYNEDAFKKLGSKYLTYYEASKHIIDSGEYYLDGNDETDSCISKIVNPPSAVFYKVISYKDVTMKGIGISYEIRTVYTYHDALNIYDDWKLNTYKFTTENGNTYTYGFYLINVNLNNTTNCFNVQCEDGDYIKYISYINSLSLSEHPEVSKELYKQIIPFVKNNPLRFFMTNAYTVISPKVFPLSLDYHPAPVMNGDKIAYYDVLFNKGKYGSATFERYFDSIVPMTKEVGILTTYNLKFKDSKKSFRPTYFTNETIYPLETSINFYPGVRVYDLTKNTYTTKYDYEWKHFNNNRGINLEESFTYTFDNYLTKLEVAINESKEIVLDIFRDHMINHTSSTLDDKGIQWAFTKYQIKYGCEPVAFDLQSNEKLYKLEILFELF